MSAVMVRVSHAYKNMDMARERISLTLELMVMLLSFQMTFSLVTAAVVWAILAHRHTPKNAKSGWKGVKRVRRYLYEERGRRETPKNANEDGKRLSEG